MQPYFLPYIGYYQLMHAVDKFVILDDVHYIKGGWVNRNIIPISAKANWMTLPLVSPSPNRAINETLIADDNGWKKKMIRMVNQSYAKHARCGDSKALFNEIIQEASGNLAEFLTKTLIKVSSFLHLTSEILVANRVETMEGMRGQDRVIGICKKLNAKTYINLPGGKNLYDEKVFAQSGIELLFLNPSVHAIKLKSGLNDSIYVSILDLIMHNDLNQIQDSLSQYELSNLKS